MTKRVVFREDLLLGQIGPMSQGPVIVWFRKAPQGSALEQGLAGFRPTGPERAVEVPPLSGGAEVNEDEKL